MKDYADKTFWKMFSGFITLIVLSMIIILLFKVKEFNKNEIDPNQVRAHINR